MKISSLVGLKDEASDDEINERIISLTRIERRLLEVTGKDNVGEAIARFVANEDAAVQLEAERKVNKEWQLRHERERAEAKSKAIQDLIEGAVLDGRVSLKNTDRIEQLRRLGEDYDDDLKAMKAAISMMEPRPVRVFAPPAPQNTVMTQMAAIDRYVKDHPGTSRGQAYIALSQSNPQLFGDDIVAVEE